MESESSSGPAVSLDALATRALAGDRQAEEALFSTLRERFLAIAKRRVRGEEIEDVVQDALRVVHGKYAGRATKVAILPWSLVVLRHVIGNYYQRERRRRRTMAGDLEEVGAGALQEAAPPWTDPLGEVQMSDLIQRVVQAMDLLDRSYPRCGALMRRLLESFARGGTPREISSRALEMARPDFPGLTPGNLYVTLHRCRARLRELLERLEGSGAAKRPRQP